MSIYRSSKPANPRPMSAPDDNHSGLRKAAPASDPLPRTLQWAAMLPHDVRPAALLSRYARIANMIALTWTDAAAFVAYMDSLLIDTRANRQGFPPDILSELLAIRRYHDTLSTKQLSGWDSVGKRG